MVINHKVIRPLCLKISEIMEIYGLKINCENEDVAYIKEQLAKLPHKQLMRGVINNDNKVYNEHDESLRGMGAARRNANNRLRNYINKTLKAQS